MLSATDREGFMVSHNNSNFPIIIIFLSICVIIVGLNTPYVMAEGQRHHKAHVHGIAHINIALEDNELYIEFVSPAANIVGFEHQPRTEIEKKALNEAIKALKAGEKLFSISHRAGARLIESVVEAGEAVDSEHESEGTHKHEADHHHGKGEKIHKAHHDKDEHEHHTESDSEHESDNSHEHEVDHHGEDEHEHHSEFKAVYRFKCKNPEKLNYIDVMLFRMYKGIEHIKVQILTRTKQTALELDKGNIRVQF